MSPSKIFLATGEPMVFWLDSSIEPKKRQSCSKLISDHGGVVTDVRCFADFSIYWGSAKRGNNKDSVWANLTWIYDSIEKGILLDIMEYTAKSAPIIINISSDSESDKASDHIRYSNSNGAPVQEAPDDHPFTNNEYLALITFLASGPVRNDDIQWKTFHRMHPKRSQKAWSNCVRHNREFFDQQISLLEAGEPFRLVDKFHPGLPTFKRLRRNAYTKEEHDAMSKHLATTKLPSKKLIWEDFHRKRPQRSAASYMRYNNAHPSLEPETRDNTPATERENTDDVAKTDPMPGNPQSDSKFTSKEIQAIIQHVATSSKPLRSVSSWKSFANKTTQYKRSPTTWHAHYMSRRQWFDEQAKCKRGHPQPLIPLLHLPLNPLPVLKRLPSLKRPPSLDDISLLPVSCRRRQAKSPGWERSETRQQHGSAGQSISSRGHGIDNNHPGPSSSSGASRVPVKSEEGHYARTIEGSKKRSNSNAENLDSNLLDILSILIMLACESKKPSIDDWIQFANKNAHRSSLSWIDFHEKHEKLFHSLTSRLGPLEDTASVQNNFSSNEALVLARFLAKEGVNPDPRVWRDFSQEHPFHSLESWVAFKNRFGRSLLRLIRGYRS